MMKENALSCNRKGHANEHYGNSKYYCTIKIFFVVMKIIIIIIKCKNTRTSKIIYLYLASQ